MCKGLCEEEGKSQVTGGVKFWGREGGAGGVKVKKCWFSFKQTFKMCKNKSPIKPKMCKFAKNAYFWDFFIFVKFYAFLVKMQFFTLIFGEKTTKILRGRLKNEVQVGNITTINKKNVSLKPFIKNKITHGQLRQLCITTLGN